MRNAILLLLFGIGLLVVPVFSHMRAKRLYQQNVSDVRVLGERLDSAKASLALATTAEDSAVIAQRVESREHYLAQRAYHLPYQEERLGRWWRLFGPATIALGLGAMFMGVGGFALRRAWTRGSRLRS